MFDFDDYLAVTEKKNVFTFTIAYKIVTRI